MASTTASSSSGNKLKDERSPYLLQHAENPVHWYPWGEEAFKAAKEKNKMIFLSVGYSTCHWCHVMERESFESDEVFAILLKFIALLLLNENDQMNFYESIYFYRDSGCSYNE